MAGGNQIRLRVASNRLKAAQRSFCGSPGPSRDGTEQSVDLKQVTFRKNRVHLVMHSFCTVFHLFYLSKLECCTKSKCSEYKQEINLDKKKMSYLNC